MKKMLIVLCFLVLTSRVLSDDPNELVLILSNRGLGGNAAITVASRSLGPDSSPIHSFSEPLSSACSQDDLVTRCRNLSVIPINNEPPRRYLAIAPLETKIGMKEFRYENGSLTEEQTYEKSLVVDCVLLDIIVSGNQVLAPCLQVSSTPMHLHSCKFQLNLTNLDSSDVSCPHVYNFGMRQYPDLNYRYITNFVYLSNYGQYVFTIHGDVYGIDFVNEDAECHGMIEFNDCERLVRTGSSKFLAYCGSSQAVELNLPDEQMQFTLDDQEGIPFMCPSSAQVWVRDIDGMIILFVIYDNDNQHRYGTSSNNFTFGQCYRGGQFFFINDQGVGVLDVSSGASTSNAVFLVDSSRTSHLVLFKGPYSIALKEDPYSVVLYNPSSKPVVRWEGRALAVGIIPDLTAPPTPSPGPTGSTSMPGNNSKQILGLSVGLGVGVPVLLAPCIIIALALCCKKVCCRRSTSRRDPIGAAGSYRSVSQTGSPPPDQDDNGAAAAAAVNIGGPHQSQLDQQEPVHPPTTHDPPPHVQHLSPDQEPHAQGPQDRPGGLRGRVGTRRGGDGSSQSEESIGVSPVQSSTDHTSKHTGELVHGMNTSPGN